MNVKIKPPCKVFVEGWKGIYGLRKLGYPNRYMTSKGWKGLIAYVEGKGGTTLVEYRRISKIK